MPRYIFLLLLGAAAGQLLAQPVADRQQRLLATYPHEDTLRVRHLNSLASELRISNIPQASLVARQAYNLAERLADVRGEIQALITLSATQRLLNDYDQARRYAKQARRLALQHHNRGFEAKALLQLSLLDMVLSNPTQALTWALQGLPLAEQAHDQETQGRLQYTIGTIYYQVADYEAALPMLLAALRQAEALNDQQVIGPILNSLGNLYQAQEQWPSALRYYQRAADLARQLGDTKTEASIEINLAEVYRRQGNQQQTLLHGRRARMLAYTHSDVANLSAVELLLARIFWQNQRPDSAIQLARHALDFYQQTGNNESASAATYILAQAYASRANFRQAYHYQNLLLAYQDSLGVEKVQRETAALRYGYELDKKKARIALLEKTRQLESQKAARQRQQMYGLLSGLGGLALLAALLWRNIYLKQRTNRRLNEKNIHIAQQRDDLNHALTRLKATQYQLAQREKMALLGEFTAGVAHEIQNPLNFVNNFAEVSSELLNELQQELSAEPLAAATQQTVQGLLHDLSESQQKIQQHGQRADAIVKSMLEHSRHHTGELLLTDLNTLVEQNLRLAYNGQAADSPDGPITLTTSLDPQLGLVEVIPQELSRVLRHLFNNAFYAVRQRQQTEGPTYQPTVMVSTRRLAEQVEIRVRDNGNGIPLGLTEKIFQPFFTTKPPGKGTGLGLSLSYDIISKSHGGSIVAESNEGEYAQFIVVLPLSPATANAFPHPTPVTAVSYPVAH